MSDKIAHRCSLISFLLAGLGSEPLATPGTTAATSPLAAPFLRNVLRVMLSSPEFVGRP